MSYRAARWFLVIVLLAVTGLRLFFAAQIELSPDEAYYAHWAEHLDWAYFSKGPGVAATIWLGTQLFGMTEFGVRFFSPILALGTAAIMWLLARRMFNESVAFWTVLTGLCMPIFWVGSLVMTIDPLSIFFWSAALFALWRALEEAPKFSLWWLAGGALIGLGFLCKYTNAFQLLCVVILLIVSRRLRGEFKRPGFWSMLLGFGLTAWPPVVWNLQNDWITLVHLKNRGGLGDDFAFRPNETLEFLGAHFGVYSPLIFLLIVAAVWKACRASRGTPRSRFLLAFGLPLFAMYLILALKSAGEANWTAPAFVSLTLLATAHWVDRIKESKGAAWLCASSLTLGLILSVLVLSTDLARTGPIRGLGLEWAYRKDPGGRLRGWKSAAGTVQEFRDAAEKEIGEKIFLIANRYQTAAELGFYLPDRRKEGPGHPPVYIPESQNVENQFSFWPRYDGFVELAKDAPSPDPAFTEQRAVNPFVGRTALFITDNTEGMPPTEIMRAFQKVEVAGECDVFRRGLYVKRWRIFLCWNYNTLPL